MIRICSALSVFAIVLSIKPAVAADVYVAPDGADTNPGTREAPLRTPQAAREAVRRMRGEGPRAKGERWTVSFLDGTYRLDSPLTLEAQDSNVVWRAEHRGKAVFSGAYAPHWRRPNADEAARVALLPDAAKAAVVVAEIPGEGPLPSFLHGSHCDTPSNTVPICVFAGDRRLDCARWPDSGFARTADVLKSDTFVSDSPRVAAWAEEPDAWTFAYWVHDWTDLSSPLREVDPVRRSAAVWQGYMKPYHKVRRFAPYFVYNAFCELDRPGEWVADRAARKVWLWPLEGNEEVMVGEGLVVAEGVSGVRFDGLVFEKTRKPALKFVRCRDIEVVAATVRNTGSWGVEARGCRKCRFAGCDLYDLGEGGLTVEGGDLETLARGDNVVDNCHIHDYGKVSASYRAGVVLQGVGNRATHNLIHHAAHAAIVFAGNDQYVACNVIHDVCRDTFDAGAIYTWQNSFVRRGGTVERNLVHDVGVRPYSGFTIAIYLDDFSSDVTVRDNVVNRSTVGIHVGGGVDNRLTGNLLLNCTHPLEIQSRGHRPYLRAEVEKDRARYRAEPWRSRYPTLLADLDYPEDGKGQHPHGTVATNNVIAVGGKDTPIWHWDKIRPTSVFDNRYFQEDPGLADFAGFDWTAKPDSPARDVIDALDFAHMGLYDSPDRATPAVRFGQDASPAGPWQPPLCGPTIDAFVCLKDVKSLPEPAFTNLWQCRTIAWAPGQVQYDGWCDSRADAPWRTYSISFVPLAGTAERSETAEGRAAEVGCRGAKDGVPTLYRNFRVTGGEPERPFGDETVCAFHEKVCRPVTLRAGEKVTVTFEAHVGDPSLVKGVQETWTGKPGVNVRETDGRTYRRYVARQADDFAFLQATDLHMTENPDIQRGALMMKDKFMGKCFIDTVNALGRSNEKPAFIALTGDLTSGVYMDKSTWPDAEFKWRHYRKYVTDRLQIPWHQIIGNNDCAAVPYLKAYPERPVRWAFERGGILFAGLHGYDCWKPENTNHAGIRYGEEQLAWLSETVRQSKARTLVLITHEPLVCDDSHVARRQLAPIVASFRGEAVWNVAGHEHRNFVTSFVLGGRPVTSVETMSPVGSWKIGDGCFRLFRCRGGRIVGSELHWMNSAGEPLRVENDPKVLAPPKAVLLEDSFPKDALAVRLVGREPFVLGPRTCRIEDRIADYYVCLPSRGKDGKSGRSAGRLQFEVPDTVEGGIVTGIVLRAGSMFLRRPLPQPDASGRRFVLFENDTGKEIKFFGYALVGVRCTAACQADNPGLEKGNVGWNVPPRNFSVRAGAGRNGSRGLVWRSVDTNLYEIASYSVPFRPGQNLKISVWVKDDGLVGGTPGQCVEFFDRKDNYIGGVGFKLAPYQPKVATNVWRRFEAETGPLPPKAAACRVDLYVKKGVTGSCVYDDVEVETLATQAEGLFYSAAPDDRANGGRVRLSATTYADLRGIPPEAIDAFFSYATASGVKKMMPESFRDGLAEAWLNVDELNIGPTRIRFVVNLKDGRKLDERRLTFTRTVEPVQGKVWFDGYRRMIVDGKPTYPLLVYISGDVEDDPRALPALDRSPFRMIMSYNRYMTTERLDRYQEHGIRAFASFCSAWTGDWNPPVEISEEWDEAAFVASRVALLKGHPALLGWYLADEPTSARMPRIRERYKTVKALDPAHPALVVLCHGRQGRETQCCCDVVGLDCYPVPGHGTEEKNPANLAAATSATRDALDGMRGDKPFWFVPQAFPNCDGRARFPTFHEMRSMVWQAIAGGADGVLFYSLGEMLSNKEKPGYAFAPAWEITCRVAQEIKDREEMLLTTEPAPAISGLPSGVVARAWRLKGKTLFVAVNTTHKPVSGTVRIGDRVVSLALGGDDVSLTAD